MSASYFAESDKRFIFAVLKMVDVAQLVRASDCGSEGRGFEPHLPPKNRARNRARAMFRALFFLRSHSHSHSVSHSDISLVAMIRALFFLRSHSVSHSVIIK